MPPSIAGYEIERDIEPPHPRCTTSDRVYAAKWQGQRVALKVLALHFPLREASSAKYLEAMARARAIASPHVIRVVDAGFAADGAPYYAMPFVDGETIASAVDRGVIASAAETKTILGQLGAAATAVATAGCTPHLHTRHILVGTGGARAWDFGVWPWRSWAAEIVAGQYVAAGQIMWHPNLTPREAKGLPATAENAAAQLALIAFSMLTARHYWAADNDPEINPMRLLVEVMAGPGAPPSTRTSIALPVGFDAWFARCLDDGFIDAATAAAAFPR